MVSTKGGKEDGVSIEESGESVNKTINKLHDCIFTNVVT